MEDEYNKGWNDGYKRGLGAGYDRGVEQGVEQGREEGQEAGAQGERSLWIDRANALLLGGIAERDFARWMHDTDRADRFTPHPSLLPEKKTNG